MRVLGDARCLCLAVGILVVSVAILLAGCKDNRQPEATHRYSVTLYASDGKPIRTWTCDYYYRSSESDAVGFYSQNNWYSINGTYIIEETR